MLFDYGDRLMLRFCVGVFPVRAAALLVGLLTASVCLGDKVTYRLEVINTWSTAHPGGFPQDAHFSWLGGGTHNDQVSFWEPGGQATAGIQGMAEHGGTEVLVQEVNAAITAGTAGGVVNYEHWFCPGETTHPSCGSLTEEFEIDRDFPLLTLASMLGPSPDWFVGVPALSLLENDEWRDQVVIDLVPYDAGTRSLNAFQLSLNANETIPHDPISLIPDFSEHLIGNLSLGTLTLTLVPEPTGAALWLAGILLVTKRRSR